MRAVLFANSLILKIFQAHPAADALADALFMFSLDLVNIVCRYLIFPSAIANAKAKLLCKFRGRGDERFQYFDRCNGVSVSFDNTIWVAVRDELQTFDENGKLSRCPNCEVSSRRCVIGHTRVRS